MFTISIFCPKYVNVDWIYLEIVVIFQILKCWFFGLIIWMWIDFGFVDDWDKDELALAVNLRDFSSIDCLFYRWRLHELLDS